MEVELKVELRVGDGRFFIAYKVSFILSLLLKERLMIWQNHVAQFHRVKKLISLENQSVNNKGPLAGK